LCFVRRSKQNENLLCYGSIWIRFIEIVTSVAGELGVGPTEGGEVMAFLNSLKVHIVTA